MEMGPIEREAERIARMRRIERTKEMEHVRRMRILFGEDAARKAAKRIQTRKRAQQKAAIRELRNLANS